MKKSQSCPKGNAIALVFYAKRSIVELIGFECKMKYDEDEPRSDRNVDSGQQIVQIELGLAIE